MTTSRFRPTPALLAALCALSFFLGGCAHPQSSAGDGLSGGEYQFLYPRQHYDSLGSWERKELDQQMQREEGKNSLTH